MIDCRASCMVGDRWRDNGAGKAAGCTTVVVEAEYDGKEADGPDAVVGSLEEAGRFILSAKQQKIASLKRGWKK